MATLSETFAQIAATHDLTVVSVGMNLNQRPEARFGATVHWNGFSTRGIPCTSEYAATPEEALRLTLERARAERTPENIDVPALELEAA